LYVIVWEFETEVRSQREFERLYGPAGVWVQLFRQAEGYVDTELLRDAEHPGRYFTIDRWETRDAFDVFKQRFPAEYEATDRECAALTVRETLLGRFQVASGAPSGRPSS
jgi:heme-degrading monooxygenase HmoA